MQRLFKGEILSQIKNPAPLACKSCCSYLSLINLLGLWLKTLGNIRQEGKTDWTRENVVSISVGRHSSGGHGAGAKPPKRQAWGDGIQGPGNLQTRVPKSPRLTCRALASAPPELTNFSLGWTFSLGDQVFSEWFWCLLNFSHQLQSHF